MAVRTAQPGPWDSPSGRRSGRRLVAGRGSRAAVHGVGSPLGADRGAGDSPPGVKITSMQAWQSIGSHHYYTDGDIVFWRMIGFLDEAHIEQLLTAVDAVLERFHHSVLLVDCSQAHSLKPEARRR